MIFQQLKKEPFRLFLVTPLLIFIVLLGLGFDGLYGQDSYEYLRYTERLVDFLKGGEYPGDLVWPKGYLFLCAFLSFILPTSLSGQLISLLCFYAVFFFLHKILSLLHGKSKDIVVYLILAYLMSPYLLRLSNVMMADTLAILCVTACGYYALAYSRLLSLRHLFWGVLWASMGAFSRYAVLVPLAPLLLWMALSWLKCLKWKQLLVLFIPLPFLGLHFYLEGNGSDFLGHHFIEHWSFSNLFKREFTTAVELQLPNVSYLLPNLVYYTLGFFHPAFFFLLPVLLFLEVNKWREKFGQFPLALLASILVYSIFLSGITFQGSRYLSLTYSLFLLIFFPAFRGLLDKIKKWQMLLIALLFSIQLILFLRAMKPSYEMNKLERSMAEELSGFQKETLYSFEVDISLQQRKLEFNYQSLWSMEYNSFEKGALVLFNEPRFASKFENKNPMNNWKKINEDYELIVLKELDQGWKLYRINE